MAKNLVFRGIYSLIPAWRNFSLSAFFQLVNLFIYQYVKFDNILPF